MRRKKIGVEAEKFIASYAESQGFLVLSRNQKINGVEIDLILQKRNKIILVEVKAHFYTGSGFETLLTDSQKERILQATAYLQRKYCLLKVEAFLAHLNRAKKSIWFYSLSE